MNQSINHRQAVPVERCETCTYFGAHCGRYYCWLHHFNTATSKVCNQFKMSDGCRIDISIVPFKTIGADGGETTEYNVYIADELRGTFQDRSDAVAFCLATRKDGEG